MQADAYVGDHMNRSYCVAMRSGAFFDLDNTLVRGSSLFHFGRFAVTRGFLSRRELLRFARAEAELAIRRTEPDGAPASVAARVLSLVRGQRADGLADLAREFARLHLTDRCVPAVVGELRMFQEVGLDTWLVTASPQELADAIRHELGMTGAIGTVSEIVDGRYTGRLAGPINHGPAKAHLVAQLAAREGVDLAHSWAYSDSINDLPLLASVQVPIVVNPNRHLAAVAAKNDWRVIRARKAERTRRAEPRRTRARTSA